MLGIERLNPKCVLPVLALTVAIAFPGTDRAGASGSGAPDMPTGLKEMCGTLSWKKGPEGTKYYLRGIQNGEWWPKRDTELVKAYTIFSFDTLPSDSFTVAGVSACNDNGCSNFVSARITHECTIGEPPPFPTRTP